MSSPRGTVGYIAVSLLQVGLWLFVGVSCSRTL